MMQKVKKRCTFRIGEDMRTMHGVTHPPIRSEAPSSAPKDSQLLIVPIKEITIINSTTLNSVAPSSTHFA